MNELLDVGSNPTSSIARTMAKRMQGLTPKKGVDFSCILFICMVN